MEKETRNNPSATNEAQQTSGFSTGSDLEGGGARGTSGGSEKHSDRTIDKSESTRDTPLSPTTPLASAASNVPDHQRDEGAPHRSFTVSVVRNTAPGGKLSKVYRYDEESGAVKKETNARLSVGSVTEETFDSIEAFMKRRSNLEPHEALMMGRPIYSPATVRTQKALKRISPDRRKEEGIIARDREHVSWPEGASLVMLDLDKPEEIPQELQDRVPKSPDDWRTLLIDCIPALRNVPMAWAPSSSSHIHHGETPLRGLQGQRFYFVVESGLITSDFKEVLRHELITRKLAWYMISKSGALLERFPFDLLVYQPERLDFAAGPVCHPPLEWRPAEWKTWNSDGPYLAATNLPTISQADLRRAHGIMEAKYKAKLPEARSIQDEWIEETGRRIALSHKGLEPSIGKSVARHAVRRGVLLPEFVLTDSEGQEVSVAEILADPAEYEGRRFHDPLEPDYRNDSRIAVCLVDGGGRVLIYSHAHGGQTWRCQPQVIQVKLGRIHQSVDQITEALQEDSCDLYVHGSEIIDVVESEAEMQSLEPDGLALRIQRRFDVVGQNQKGVWVPKNISPRDLRALNSEAHSLPIPKLKGIVRGPYARADGTIVDEPGYDAASEVLYLSASECPPRVRETVGLAQAEEALRTLLSPFSEFPFDTNVDRGVLLAALLTAVVRPSIEIAPAYLVTAPSAGSGKTILTQAIGLLQTGTLPAVTTLPERDEEIRKLVFAVLRQGAGYLLFDNAVRGSRIESAALAGLITSPKVAQRVLQYSLNETRPNRLTVAFTGNNISTFGDMNRRVLKMRITPPEEHPWTRSFEFHPIRRVRARWLSLRIAALELYRAGRQDGAPDPEESSAFPQWDQVVRPVIDWIIARLDVGVGFVDPTESFKSGYADDPESEALGDLLEALREVFGARDFQVKDVEDAIRADCGLSGLNDVDETDRDDESPAERLAKARRAALGPPPRTGDYSLQLGLYFAKYEGRVTRGFHLAKSGKSGGSRRWSVQTASAEETAA